MSKHNNRRNSNSNLGDETYFEKSIKFNKEVSFDESLNILFVEDSTIDHHIVSIEAPKKLIKSIKINNNGIFLKNKQYKNKSFEVFIKGRYI